ncbi:MAG TPA: glycosyltransferase family 39 protein [Acetobacteraceae bacterium]|nr:glycosyltransferase family 39 protein [Acetobacteraceae bacterium]
MPGGKIAGVLLLATALLVAASCLRGAEYDEQYTLFLTGGTARPVWPSGVVTAGEVQALQNGHASLAAIAHDLRATDVHPPLYFWIAATWRWLFGDGLLTARLLSVLCGVAALGVVAIIARQTSAPVVTAVLVTLGCYGFVYTDVVARGFAQAQLLNLAGIALLLPSPQCRRKAFCAGLLLGAATFTNYLAAFIGCAALLWAQLARRRSWPWAALGFLALLPADLWFYVAQHGSRIAQFEPFSLTSSASRLMRYTVAAVFGGLPLYVTGVGSYVVAAAIAAFTLTLSLFALFRWRRIHPLLALCAIAPPAGLLLLGLAFDNTPIELRYLAFATPFIGLMLASVLPRRPVYAILALQALSLIGLMTRAETMQPARATALAAAALARNGIVLVPHGNDGVGIVGAVAREAPPTLRLLVIRPDDTPTQILARTGNAQRVVLALLGQDSDSRATLPHMRAAFDNPCWRAVGQGFNVLAFERIRGEE